VVAAQAEAETTGNSEYQNEHMSAIFQEGLSFSGYERDYLGMNMGGTELIDVSGVSGLDSIGDGRGAALADFDNDGDLDIFLVSFQRNAHELFRNNIGSDHGFVRVALEGTDSGRDGFGAVVRAATPNGVITKLKSAGSGFLAQNDPRLLIGLGAAAQADWIEVSWPSGLVQRVDGLDGKTGIPAGASLLIREGGAATRVNEETFALADPLSSEDRTFAGLTFDRGDLFPDLTLLDRDQVAEGRALPGPAATSLRELLRPGRRTLLNIWATWCVPCRREMPELEQLSVPLAAAGVDLVGISIDTDTAARVVPFLREVGTTYAVHVSNDDRIPGLFEGGAIVVPLSILLDDTGRVLRVIGGWSVETAEQFHALTER